jgi:hypothetical protein
MLSTDEGYQLIIEAYVGNFTAKIAASKLEKTKQTVRMKTIVLVEFKHVQSQTIQVLLEHFGFEILLLPGSTRVVLISSSQDLRNSYALSQTAFSSLNRFGQWIATRSSLGITVSTSPPHPQTETANQSAPPEHSDPSPTAGPQPSTPPHH